MSEESKIYTSYMARHRPICSVLDEIQYIAYQRNDDRTVKLCEEAIDYARRMSARLMEHKRREEGND